MFVIALVIVEKKRKRNRETKKRQYAKLSYDEKQIMLSKRRHAYHQNKATRSENSERLYISEVGQDQFKRNGIEI